MRAIQPKRLVNIQALVCFIVSALAPSAWAEYYVVYSAPAVIVDQPAPCCQVVRAKPCYTYKKPKKYHYRKYCRPYHTVSACPVRRSCSQTSVYYPISAACGACSTGGGVALVGTGPVNVVYGPPLYRPDTYHPVNGYDYYGPSVDLSTGDDIYYY